MAESKDEKQPTFEEQLAELETIVQQLDAEDVPLEQAIAYYEQGVKLSAKLNKTLDQVQRKIEVLTQNEAGDLVQEPFEEAGDNPPF